MAGRCSGTVCKEDFEGTKLRLQVATHDFNELLEQKHGQLSDTKVGESENALRHVEWRLAVAYLSVVRVFMTGALVDELVQAYCGEWGVAAAEEWRWRMFVWVYREQLVPLLVWHKVVRHGRSNTVRVEFGQSRAAK